MAEHGNVDVLVNSAGIGPLNSAIDTPDDEWRAVIDVNLNGLFWCCRAFGRHMIAQRSGSIINLGSMSDPRSPQPLPDEQPGRRPSRPPTSRCCSRRSPERTPSPTSAFSTTRSAAAADLFTREDMVEETWRVVQPLLDKPGKVIPYDPGTWGPEEASRLTRGVAEWHEPWMPEPG